HFVIRLKTLSTNDSFVYLILFDHDQGQMNDASEVLEAILRRMHDSFTYRADYLAESHERNCSGSWDCANDECIAHDMFGADVHERMICYNCGLESRQQKYTSFLHYINACSLNYAMRICPGNSFDDILKAVMMDVHRTCDPDVGGCGKSNHMSHTLSSSPFGMADWKWECEGHATSYFGCPWD
uniref:USP domain-containing protein n=1 Tax=Aegilops tauschii subsp. strangulata TaxID=200361 RepID=A0A453KMX8_AEGTS